MEVKLLFHHLPGVRYKFSDLDGFTPHFVDIRLETLGLNGDLVINEIESNDDIKQYFCSCTRNKWARSEIMII